MLSTEQSFGAWKLYEIADAIVLSQILTPIQHFIKKHVEF